MLQLPIGAEFIEQTFYEHLEVSEQARGVEAPPAELPAGADEPLIDLPAPSDIAPAPADLWHVIEARRSRRTYSARPLDLADLSLLLWCTQGVKACSGDPVLATFRTVPSAGARHAFETYVLVNRVEGLQPGLYRFLAIRHKLIRVRTGPDLADELTGACFDQAFVRTSAATFIWTAVVHRMAWRYGQRGYRYLFLDAGHICQNLYLAAEGIDAGCCAIAAYDDQKVSEFLDIDGREQLAVYLATVGHRAR